MKINSLKTFVAKGDSRSIQLKKNILGSMSIKGIGIVVSLLIVPMTIDYVNPIQYGIWLTLSSLLAWFSFFDIGLGLGLRNKFAESKAKKNIKLAQEYVSTAYAALSFSALLLLMVSLAVNSFIDWSLILNLPKEYDHELKRVFVVMISFFSLSLVASIITNVLIADQRTAFSSFISVIGQIIILCTIFILTKTVVDGSLITLAFVLSGIPQMTLIISSLILYRGRYKYAAPKLSAIKLKLIKDILGMGGKFFLITTSMLFIFQIINIVLTRELGPKSVTEYNIAYKYFNTAYMVLILILTPFWAAFTDAYTKGNYEWMYVKVRQLERLWIFMIPILIFMLLISPQIYKLWVGNQVSIPFSVSLSVMIYIASLSFANIYMYVLNGIGKVKIQLYIYLSFAIIAFPIMSFFCRHYGICGLLIIPTLVYIFQALILRIQTHKIIKQKSTGIWNK